MICKLCHYEVSELDVVFDKDMPANPYHEDCYKESHCECGRRIFNGPGRCESCKEDELAVVK